MAWKDLKAELEEMFGGLTQDDSQIDSAVYEKLVNRKRETNQEWERLNHLKRQAQERARVDALRPANWEPKNRKKHGPALPDWLRKKRARERSNTSYHRNLERSRQSTLARVHKHRARKKANAPKSHT